MEHNTPTCCAPTTSFVRGAQWKREQQPIRGLTFVATLTTKTDIAAATVTTTYPTLISMNTAATFYVTVITLSAGQPTD